MKYLLMLAALFLLPAPSHAWALGTGAGDGGCGSRENFPESKYGSILSLETQIADSDPDKIRRLIQVGKIFAVQGFTCGNLNEEDAMVVASDYLEHRRGLFEDCDLGRVRRSRSCGNRGALDQLP